LRRLKPHDDPEVRLTAGRPFHYGKAGKLSRKTASIRIGGEERDESGEYGSCSRRRNPNALIPCEDNETVDATLPKGESRGKTIRMRIKKMILGVLCALMCVCGTTNAQKIQDKGIASYYGKTLHGRKTSSGERFDMHAMTCAHRTLPFGTVLKVRDTKTGKEVHVRVTDRGPFGKGRVVDLSYGAAKKLGIVSRGIAQVEITAMPAGSKVEELNAPENQQVPEMKFYDPATGRYYAAAEWKDRQEKEKQAKQHYRVLDGNVTAKAEAPKK